jgi:serpin B
LRTLDFAGMPEESRIIINDWVSEQTENRINDLIPAGSITPLTELILTNAIYFKAAWFYQFNEYRTITDTFHLADGGSVEVPMMKLPEHLNYAAGNNYQALELYYQGRTVSMVILLPKAGQFESFEKSLKYPKLEDILDNLSNREVNLTMPKFNFTLDFKLSKTLKDMGMPLAFSGGADFSGMSKESVLGIDEVCHKAFVAVDEEGTEAAAATAVMIAGAAPGRQPEPVDFTMDRPFIFLIRDIETNSILFMGRVMNPVETE